MKAMTWIVLLSFVAFMTSCYASRSHNGNDAGPDAPDAAHDGVPDTLPDSPPDAVPDAIPDTAPDAVPDGVDVPDLPPTAPYALHEWGVISTGMGGSAVHGPAPVSTMDIADKPVIYLRSEGDVGPVSIGVSFVPQLSSQVWPSLPAGTPLAWNNLRLGRGDCLATPFPYPWDADPCEVCNLGTCVVEDADCLTFAAPDGTVTTSKLLFYSGPMGGFSPQLEGEAVMALTDDEGATIDFTVRNASPRAVRDVWLIYRDAQGPCIEPWMACPVSSASLAFMHLDTIEAGQAFSQMIPVEFYQAPLDPSGWPTGDLPLPEEWLNQGKELTDKLVERGLTQMEAGAFLANWNEIFFGLLAADYYYVEPLYANGALLIYFMDREAYDAQFPLTATPAPRESVRVGMVYQVLPML
jgi:hypothetical protein